MSYYDYNYSGVNPFYGGQFPQMSNPYYQPQMQQAMNNCQCDNRFMWIQGKEAAKAYPVAPDKTIFFLDDKESYAYLKKTDKDGKTVDFKTFQLIEEKEQEPVLQTPLENNYISKEEFESSINELKEMILASQYAPKYNKPQYNKGKQVRNDG